MNFPVAGTLSGRELRRLKHSRSLAAARQRDKLEKLAPSGCFGGLVGREELRQRRQMFSRVETGAGGDDATFAFGVWYVTKPLGPGGLLPALDASPSVAERALAETQRKRSLDVLRQARETRAVTKPRREPFVAIRKRALPSPSAPPLPVKPAAPRPTSASPPAASRPTPVQSLPKRPEPGPRSLPASPRCAPPATAPELTLPSPSPRPAAPLLAARALLEAAPTVAPPPRSATPPTALPEVSEPTTPSPASSSPRPPPPPEREPYAPDPALERLPVAGFKLAARATGGADARAAEATGIDADDINFCSKTTSGGLGSGMRACGCQLWAASVVLIQFLCARPETVRGRRVLELGSGSGLTGLVARVLLGASKVVLSDSNPHVLKLLRHNCELNCEANPRMARNSLQVASLDWASKSEARDLLHAHAADARGDGFDVILASDTVYEPSSTRHVWRCVGDMLSHEPGACFVCAYELRLCFKDLFSNFQAEGRRAGFIAEEIDIAAFLEVEDFQINTDEVCRPVEPSSGDWETLRLYVFRRIPGF